MKRRHDSSREHEVAVDLTPMIDMVFLLVMFFVLTSSFVLLEDVLLPVALEATESIKEEDEGVLIINVRAKDDAKREGVLVFNGQEVTKAELAEALKLESQFDAQKRGWDDPKLRTSKLQVLVRADQGVQMRYVRQILTACQEAGIWKVKTSALQE
jgi:biopolymer transport protein ExbD